METNLVLVMIFAIIVCQVLMLVYYFKNKGLGTGKDEGRGTRDWDTLHDAIKKSQAIIGNSELEGIKHTATVDHMLKEGMARVNEEYKQELNDQTKQAVAEFRDQLEKNMHEIQNGFAKDLALYKAKKEQAIDTNAEEIIDRAVELYLGKKLDKKEHMQLIFEALERAKAELSLRA